MNKILTSATAIMATAVLLTGCNGDKLRDAEAQNEQLKGDLRETLATQDSLLVLVNDISDGMAQIKEMEKIVSTPGGIGEMSSDREQIKNDMIAIQKALQERRERLEELEKKLASQSGENSTLKRTIATLKAQIADQQTEIATLTNQLASANIKISELSAEVGSLTTAKDSLSANLAQTSEQKAVAEAAATAAENELNTVYYTIGTSKELKEHNILQSGFLRKTKVMEGDFDRSYFSVGDRRTLTVIPTHASKAKIVSNQPSDSYVIVDENGQKVVKILDPKRFWEMSNFLVIQIN